MQYLTREEQQAVAADTKLARIAQVFMERSGRRPVEIWLWNRRGQEKALLMKELLVHKSRWGSLTLVYINNMDAEPFIAAMASGVPSLQRLHVGSKSIFSLPLSLETTPRLSSVIVTRYSCTLRLPSRSLTQLRFLDVGGDSLGLVNWLENCPALEELTSYFNYDSREDIINLYGKEIQLPILNKLKLKDARLEQSQVLLNYLRAPALRSFWFRPSSLRSFWFRPSSETFLSHLRNFLQRSVPSLESLLFIGREQRLPDGLIDILSTVPTLQELKLVHLFVDNRVVEALTYRSSSRTVQTMDAPLCPQLHLIDFAVKDDVSAGAVVDMISSRCKNGDPDSVAGVHKLEKMRIFDPNKALLGLQDHAVIVDCVLHGLYLEVSTFCSLKD